MILFAWVSVDISEYQWSIIWYHSSHGLSSLGDAKQTSYPIRRVGTSQLLKRRACLTGKRNMIKYHHYFSTNIAWNDAFQEGKWSNNVLHRTRALESLCYYVPLECVIRYKHKHNEPKLALPKEFGKDQKGNFSLPLQKATRSLI